MLHAMKITQLEILKVPPSWVWLKVHTDEGIVGLGEPYLENHPEPVIAEVRRLEPFLIGQDPTQVERLWSVMYDSGLGYKGGPVKMSALSGIDIALWDIAGKAAGLPVHRLLGGACRDRIRMYRATGGSLPWCVDPGRPYREGRPPRPVAASLDVWEEGARILVQEWGFRCLKVHFGPGEGLEVTRRVDDFAEKFAAVRRGAGPEVDVAVDIHNPHPAIASQLIEVLAPLRPLFVEEPMPIERVDALVDIARRTHAPIAAGERWMGKWVFFDALSRGALAVLQPDLCHAGGITECRKIAAMGEAAFAKVALHCPLSPLALAASIQLDACLPNFLVQEHNEVLDWRADGRTTFGRGYLKDPFVLDGDGCVAVPTRPGLGIELDEDGLAEIMALPWHEQRG
jgi:galactonate dehydratase